jgi:hypothetical protein
MDSRAEKLREIITRACERNPQVRLNLKQMQSELSLLIGRKIWFEIRLPDQFDTWNDQAQTTWKERIEQLAANGFSGLLCKLP